MRYFECLVDTYKTIKKGVIYPSNHHRDEYTIVGHVGAIPNFWQERTEAEYLAQENQGGAEKYHGNTVEYWKKNAEEDYLTTPISVLKYITVLEEQYKQLQPPRNDAGN